MQDGVEKSFIVGITNGEQIVEMKVSNGNRGSFSCSTNTYIPITEDRAIERERTSLIDFFSHGEHFDNVASGEVIEDEDGGFTIRQEADFSRSNVLEHFDNSLQTARIKHNGETYIFDSVSCGQVREIHDKIEHYFVDEDLHRKLVEQWDNHHLDNEFRTDLEIPEQDEKQVLREAVEIIVD